MVMCKLRTARQEKDQENRHGRVSELRTARQEGDQENRHGQVSKDRRPGSWHAKLHTMQTLQSNKTC